MDRSEFIHGLKIAIICIHVYKMYNVYTSSTVNIENLIMYEIKHDTPLLPRNRRNWYRNELFKLYRITIFNMTKKVLALRFGHRFRLEQRLFENTTELRSRYGFAVDLPLNGEKLDVGESYFMASSEFLYNVGNDIKPELDNRTGAHIGWALSKNLNFQVGLEYRFVTFNIATEHELYFLSSIELEL